MFVHECANMDKHTTKNVQIPFCWKNQLAMYFNSVDQALVMSNTCICSKLDQLNIGGGRGAKRWGTCFSSSVTLQVLSCFKSPPCVAAANKVVLV